MLLLITYYHADRLAKLSEASKVTRFKACYGMMPQAVAQLWEDLLTEEIIDPDELTIIRFLMGLFHLKCYLTEVVQSAIFKCGVKTVRKYNWMVVQAIQALKAKKIIWLYDEDHYEDDDSSSGELSSEDSADKEECPDLVNRSDNNDSDDESYSNESDDESYVLVEDTDLVDEFIASVDGVHFRIEEPIDPEYRKNPKYYSHKFKQAALAMEVALDLFENQVVWINGPFPASTNDLNIFRAGLKDKIPAGKKFIGDKGYRAEEAIVSTHNALDDDDVRTLKKRAMARQESFNSRIKQFGCCSGRFRHKLHKFKSYVEAVIILCQYQMENGSPLFVV